jgi:hypothetical protein
MRNHRSVKCKFSNTHFHIDKLDFSHDIQLLDNIAFIFQRSDRVVYNC